MSHINNSEFDLLEISKAMDFGDIHVKIDPKTQLHAIIAIHNTDLGPALGGCRCVHYPSGNAALYDAMRLAQGMSYKAAISGLCLGGGKSVLIRPGHLRDREAYFESFGEFVDQLGGRYITAVDSGTAVSDMDVIARRTRHVVSTSERAGDPSPLTAHGVLRGIQAAVKARLNRDDLQGIHVAIQGAGHVGYPLAKDLHQRGAKLTICSNKQEDAQRVAEEFDAQTVAKEDIYSVECDVFAPCALGGVVNAETVQKIRAKIIAGAANNQLSEPGIGIQLRQKNIAYAPDYVINAGGLIHVAISDEKQVREKIDGIYATVLEIFQRAEKSSQTTNEIADQMAKEVIAHADSGACANVA